ncbi:MAG: ATPase, T2SS/T4P/T4SS family [Elusimicrobia bacterium]|nr:ATPase, T2SS/T4P/T4SS family [Elusimicrobiota bacterium]
MIAELLAKVEAPEEIEVLGEAAAEEDSKVGTPVIMLVNSIISQAHRQKSSDIHIEHEEKISHVRVRIDGVLKNIMSIPKHIAAGPLVARIKIMAELDISNHMRPQDGRAKLKISGVEVGLRVSTLPTSYGEKVVMRILDQRAAEVPFEKLGFAAEISRAFEKCIEAPQGIILVTGPTGSGKTTTLYSVLNKCRSEGTNITTVEDPIEYKLQGINQVQVNEKQGLNFAAVLRSVLRQDPDIIMVGEIRDHETADIAFQAAMTGHLVFSTLHTNDTVSTISRLVDMGVERFKISPGLLAITAQRLVRKLCPACKAEVPRDLSDPAILAALREHGYPEKYYVSKGCKECGNEGHAGRTSIVELLLITDAIKTVINSGAQGAEITRIALDSGNLRTMTRDALWHLAEGVTSLGEISPYLLLDKKPAEAAPAPATAPVLQTEAEADAQARSPGPAAGGPMSVMVVDDIPIIRLLLRKALEAQGYEVKEAVDGEEALTSIAAQSPDLLISDINMPHMNGLDLIKGIRQGLGITDMPIIILTTETSDESQELALQLGADDYITKPFKQNIVVARVNAALRRFGKVK